MAIFPSQAFTKDNVKVRWKERYTSESVNKKFLGLPRGVYAGFRPLTTSGSLLLTLGTEPAEGYSMIRVESGPGTDAVVMVDIITTSSVILDFTGHAAWPVYVIGSADYEVGVTSTAQVFTRATPAATPGEVTVCKVDRPGNTGDLVISPSSVFPTSDVTARQEPYAFGDVAGPPFTPGQRFGFMPKGSKEILDAAEATTLEVETARVNMLGPVVPTVVGATQPSLAARLYSDLTGVSMAGRLGYQIITVPSNSGYNLPGTVVSIVISSASTFINGDVVTTGVLTNGGVILSGGGTTTLIVDVGYGTFTTGTLDNTLSTPPGTASASIVSVTPSCTFLNVSGSFSTRRRNAESPPNFPAIDSSVTSVIPAGINPVIPPGGTETPSTEGALCENTSGAGGIVSDTFRNVCFIIKIDTGERLVDANGNSIFGRLEYAKQDTLPGSVSFTFGGATPSVVTMSSNPAGIVSVGDIIQVPTTAGGDGRFYEVTAMASSPGDALTISPSYGGTLLTVTGADVNRRRFKLNLKSRTGGGGSEITIPAITSPTLVPVRFFFSAWFTLQNSNYDGGLLMLSPGEPLLPDATTAIKGKVLLAPDLGVVASTVVQGSDARVNTPIQGKDSGGSPVGTRYHHVKAGTNVILTDGGGGDLVIAVPTGGTGSPGGPGSPGPPGPTGPGFSSLGTWTEGPTIGFTSGSPAPSGGVPGTVPFSYGFSVKMFAVCISNIKMNAPSMDDEFEIVSASASGSTVTVSYVYTVNSGFGDFAVKIGCNAAG